MPLAYESTIYCDRSQEVLINIMQEAVERYLSSNPKVSVVERNERVVVLKIPMSLKSWGEKLKIVVKKRSFLILSESSAFWQGHDWGKNAHNARTMCSYINYIDLLSQ